MPTRAKERRINELRGGVCALETLAELMQQTGLKKVDAKLIRALLDQFRNELIKECADESE